MPTYTAQGEEKQQPSTVPKGTIVLFYGPRVPSGWALCDGTLGTPNLLNALILGDTAVTNGTAGGASGVGHSGFAVGAHSNHTIGQGPTHDQHTPTNAANHSVHVATQPNDHDVHAGPGTHTHNSHTTAANGSAPVTGAKITGPVTHAAAGNHDHSSVNNHSHSGWGVDAHASFGSPVHSGFVIAAGTDHDSLAHTGADLDTHSAHSPTQAAGHSSKIYRLAYIIKQ